MAWRPARSLDVLLAEVNAIAPDRSKRSDGTIGDQEHAATDSDHNPNARDVVCARDITHDPAHGADMHKIAAAIVRANPPALKYLIWNRRIYFPGHGWSRYYGSNPHDKHLHASVGHGPDGASTGNYDDASPWGVAKLESEDDPMLGLKKGDKGDRVELLQGMLKRAGFDPGKVDGVYGVSTSKALFALRKADTPDTTAADGDEVTPYALIHLWTAFAKAQGGGERGERGEKGEKGDPGPAAKWPAKVSIVGTATSAP